MRTRLAFASAALATTLGAACGGDDVPLANHARMAAQDRHDAVTVASGQVTADLAALAVALAERTDDGCTSSTQTDTALTARFSRCRIEGDSPDGLVYGGAVTVHGDAGDPRAITRIDIHDLTFVDWNVDVVIDGSIEYQHGAADTVVTTSLFASIELFSASTAFQLDSRYRHAGDRVTPVGTSTVSWNGQGTAFIEGSWSLGAAGGSLALGGEDTLVVDFDAPATGQCHPAFVDGAATEAVCLDMKGFNGTETAAQWLRAIADRFR